MNFVNLTQHPIVVRLPSGQERRFAPSGQVARCATTELEDGLVDGIPVVTRAFGRVDGLPAPQEGTAYLAGSMVAGHPDVRGRKDVFAPDTGPTALREGGQVVAVVRLVRA